MDINRFGRKAISVFVALGLSGSVMAADIVRWVDANGVVHFSDRAAAPPGSATVEIGETNGMDAPEVVVSNGASASTQVVRLKKSSIENKRGWRGRVVRSRPNTIRVPAG